MLTKMTKADLCKIVQYFELISGLIDPLESDGVRKAYARITKGIVNAESVADHSFITAVICILFADLDG